MPLWHVYCFMKEVIGYINMKKKFLVIVLHLFTASGVFAQSMLKVSAIDRIPISVALDGRHFSKHGESITVGDVPPGRHYLKIYSYELTKRGYEREELLYEGRVNTEAGMVTVFMLDEENGNADVQQQEISNNNENHNSYAQENNENRNEPPPPPQPENNPVNNTPPPPPPPATPVASPVSKDKIITLTGKKMDKLKKKVEVKKTDTERIKVMKAGISKDKYYTSQVAEMMDWLIFESSKVDFAKIAYPNAVDKDNYYNELSLKFSFKNSQDELSKFLSEYKGK